MGLTLKPNSARTSLSPIYLFILFCVVYFCFYTEPLINIITKTERGYLTAVKFENI